MASTPRPSDSFDYPPQITALAIRQISDKARFGIFYYLFALVGIYLIGPNLRIASLQFAILLTLFLLLAIPRELAFRLAEKDDSQLALAKRCLEFSFLSNGIAWTIFSFIALKSESSTNAIVAAVVVTSSGLTAGGCASMVPHYALIRFYSLIMMGGVAILLPLLIGDAAAWFISPLCLLYTFFMFRMGRIQSHVYWQLLETNEMLKRQTEELAEAQIKALAGAHAKSEFLANMSHEIRTPMNGVIGMTELLGKTELTAEQKNYLKIIHDAGTTLMSIIDDILDFSKLEARKMNLVMEPVNLDILLRDIHALFSPQLDNSQVKLNYDNSANLNDWVLTDPTRLRQLMYNLVGNAIKFTPQGSITIKIERAKAVDEQDYRIRFSVIDTGIGIAETNRSHIFKKFEQIGHSPNIKGTGLGLAICKHLVDLMNGCIDFESTPGAGTCFWFELPLAVVKIAEVRSENTHVSHDTQMAVDVLLVEDNAINQIVAHGMLQHCGCSVYAANSGEEAVAAIKQKNFHLIFMDCNMPGTDGFSATQSIRAWEAANKKSRTPIIALTANVLDDVKQRCIEAGMDDYLAKPFRLSDIATAVQRWSRATH